MQPNSKIELRKALRHDQPRGFRDTKTRSSKARGKQSSDKNENGFTAKPINMLKRTLPPDDYTDLYKNFSKIKDNLTEHGHQCLKRLLIEASEFHDQNDNEE